MKGKKKNRFHAFYISLCAVALAELILFLVDHAHTNFWWEEIPAFNALYGFVSCALLIIIAKVLGYWLKKDEAYYKKIGGAGGVREQND